MRSPFNNAMRGALINFTSGEPKSGPEVAKELVATSSDLLKLDAISLTFELKFSILRLSLLVMIKEPRSY